MNTKRKVLLRLNTSYALGRDITSGIIRYSRNVGTWSLHTCSRLLMKDIVKLKGLDVDGIIAFIPSRKKAMKLSLLGIPVIAVQNNELLEGFPFPYIMGDSTALGKIAAEYFTAKGFKNYAFYGTHNVQWSTQRSEAFSRSIAEFGYHVDIYQQPASGSLSIRKNSRFYLAEWLEKLPKPVAIFANNDIYCQKVIETCNEYTKLNIPNDIAILGVDNDELICTLCNPPLSSIARDAEKVGYDAAEFLDKMMKGEKVDRHKLLIQPTRVVERQSTDVIAVENKEVAKALHYIRQNGNKILQVAQIVEETTTSRRVLQNLFQKYLGYSIQHEIHRTRIQKVANMLLETNLPFYKIASSVGYTQPENASRFFKKQMKMSPLVYRKKYST